MVFLLRRFKLKKEKRTKEAVEDARDIPEKPIRQEAPACDSCESSEVDYVENDETYIKAVLPQTALFVMETPSPEASLPCSVAVRMDMIDDENASNLSLEGIMNRPPQLFAEKVGKLNPRFSMNTSATSETQVTVSASENTYSEVGSVSTTTEKHQDKAKKRLESWKEVMEEELKRLGTNNPRAVTILLDLGSTYLQNEVCSLRLFGFVQRLLPHGTRLAPPHYRTT
jgi:hypothetical protein